MPEMRLEDMVVFMVFQITLHTVVQSLQVQARRGKSMDSGARHVNYRQNSFLWGLVDAAQSQTQLLEKVGPGL